MKKTKNLLYIIGAILVIPVGVYLASQKTNFFNNAFGTNANLVIDASRVIGGKSESWRNLAQGGEDKSRQLLPVINEVKALRPKYIRIDHVFDYYNEGELDQMIADITATGAKPFISLSYMPANLAQNGDVTSLPSDWVAWEALVQRTIEHISGRNGLNISDVYYEVWNEPDLFGGFKTYGNKNYLDLYAHTVRPAMRASNVNAFKIGGPATTGFYTNWFDKLVEFNKSNNLRLDFISWHNYSKNLSDYEDNLVAVIRYPETEPIISELGPNSENDNVYDNNFGAIHLIATTALLEGKIDKLFNFEIKDGEGKEKYWGRWGMLTHEKWGATEVKPRYRAIQFLNNLIGGENLEVVGQGSWVKSVAKQSPGKIQIMIINYDTYGRHSEAVPIRVTNLPSNIFALKRINFNGMTTSSSLTVTDNIWETTFYFEPNTASILELTF